MESDAVTNVELFLSTLPVRGATLSRAQLARQIAISIHAPREGSDPRYDLRPLRPLHFYPRSP